MKIIETNILIPLVEDSYRNDYTEWKRRNLRFSDAGAAAVNGSKCEREIYYDIHLAEEKSLLSSGTLTFFADGRLAEEDMRRRLRTVLRSPEKEVEDPTIGARGKVDNTIFRSSVKELVAQYFATQPEYLYLADVKEDPGLEIKSVNEFTYQMMAKKKTMTQSYYDQVQYYLWATKKPYWIVLIKNRNGFGSYHGALPYLEFIVFPDTKRQTQIRNGLRITKQAVDNGIMPPRPFERESTQCSYCRFKHVCWPPRDDYAPELPPMKEGVEAPAEEVMDAMAHEYAKLKKKEKEAKDKLDIIKPQLTAYFITTREEKFKTGGVTLTYSPTKKTDLDLAFLKEKLSSQEYMDISIPDRKALYAAIADRKIDAKVADDALTEHYTYSLRVSTDSSKVSRVSKLKKTEVTKKKRKADGKGKSK